MNEIAWTVIGIVIVAVVLLLAMGARLGRFKLRLFGKSAVEAETRENRRGAHADKAKAGRNIHVTDEDGGCATANGARAGQDIRVTSKGANGWKPPNQT